MGRPRAGVDETQAVLNWMVARPECQDRKKKGGGDEIGRGRRGGSREYGGGVEYIRGAWDWGFESDE